VSELFGAERPMVVSLFGKLSQSSAKLVRSGDPDAETGPSLGSSRSLLITPDPSGSLLINPDHSRLLLIRSSVQQPVKCPICVDYSS